jgi:hypothetical protein
MSRTRLWPALALAFALGFAAGWFTHRPSRREAPGPVPGLADRLVIDYPTGEVFPTRRTVSLRIDRARDGSGAVVFDRRILVDGSPPAWKLTAGGYTYFAVPVPE